MDGELALLLLVYMGVWCIPVVAVGWSSVASTGTLPPALTASIGVVLTLAAALVWLARRVGRTCTTVELSEETLAVFHDASGPLRLAVSWGDVRGFDDGDRECVALRLPLGRIFIATPTESDRVALLAFLDARGVKQLD